MKTYKHIVSYNQIVHISKTYKQKLMSKIISYKGLQHNVSI